MLNILMKSYVYIDVIKHDRHTRISITHPQIVYAVQWIVQSKKKKMVVHWMWPHDNRSYTLMNLDARFEVLNCAQNKIVALLLNVSAESMTRNANKIEVCRLHHRINACTPLVYIDRCNSLAQSHISVFVIEMLIHSTRNWPDAHISHTYKYDVDRHYCDEIGLKRSFIVFVCSIFFFFSFFLLLTNQCKCEMIDNVHWSHRTQKSHQQQQQNRKIPMHETHRILQWS